jgi:hypothetical protein
MITCANCRGLFDPDTSTSQDPERFCKSNCEEVYSGFTPSEVDPDDLPTFTKYLNHYTARGGMTEDERTAFWTRWMKEAIAWVFVAVVALIVKGMYSGVVDMLASAIGAFAILGGLGWQAVEAVLFNHKARRWQS